MVLGSAIALCFAMETSIFDIEDRSFHGETKRNGGAEYHFSANCRPIPGDCSSAEFRGFSFTPADDRRLRVTTDPGRYHPQAEWSENIAHPIEQTRGQVASGDAYSPGWFELPLPKGGRAVLVVDAEQREIEP